MRVDESCHLLACVLEGGFDRFCSAVAGGGIVELLFEERQHRLQHLGVDRSSRVVIEVNHSAKLVFLWWKARRIFIRIKVGASTSQGEVDTDFLVKIR